MEVDFLRFVLVDPKYRIRLLPQPSSADTRDDAVVGMQCWKGYLFWATTRSVHVCRCDDKLLAGSVELLVLNTITLERAPGEGEAAANTAGEIRGMLVTAANSVCYYTQDTIYSIECEWFVKGKTGVVPTPSPHPLAKVTDVCVLSQDGEVYERVGFEKVQSCRDKQVVDVDGEWALLKSGLIVNTQQNKNSKVDIGPGTSSMLLSLHVLKEDVFAVGLHDGDREEYNLVIVDRGKQCNMGNLTGAYKLAGGPFGHYNVHYFSNYGSISDIVVVSHSQSVGLSLAGKIAPSEEWKVLDLANDEYMAEMPMSESADDTFSLLSTIDLCNTWRLRLPDDVTEVREYPVSPIVCVLSSDHRLIPFQLVNTAAKEPLECMEPLASDHVRSEEDSPSAIPGFMVSSSSSLADSLLSTERGSQVSKIGSTTHSSIKDVKTADDGKAKDDVKASVAAEGIVGSQTAAYSVLSPSARPQSPVKAQPALTPPRQSEHKVEEKRDFGAKQNTLIQAFIDLHALHSGNLASIRRAIDELSSLAKELNSSSNIKEQLDAAQKGADSLQQTRQTVWKAMESAARIKSHMANLRERMNANDLISAALTERKEELIGELDDAAAFCEYSHMMSKLTLQEGGGEKMETLVELERAAREKLGHCSELVNFCLLREDVAEKTDRQAQNVHQLVELKKALGRRRVELRDVSLSETIPGKDDRMMTKSGFSASKGWSLQGIPAFPSMALYRPEPGKNDGYDDDDDDDTVATENALPPVPSLVDRKLADKQTSPAPEKPLPGLQLVNPSVLPPKEAAVRRESEALPSIRVTDVQKIEPAAAGPKDALGFSALSFGGESSKAEGAAAKNIFSFTLPTARTAPAAQPSLIPPTSPPQTSAAITTASAHLQPLNNVQQQSSSSSPFESPLNTPIRQSAGSSTNSNNYLASFGQIATFAPVVPPLSATSTASSSAAPAAALGFASFSNPSTTTFGSLASGTPQAAGPTGFGSLVQQPSQQQQQQQQSSSKKLPSSFTQFRG